MDNIYLVADSPTKQPAFIAAVPGHTDSAQAVAVGPSDYASVDYW